MSANFFFAALDAAAAADATRRDTALAMREAMAPEDIFGVAAEERRRATRLATREARTTEAALADVEDVETRRATTLAMREAMAPEETRGADAEARRRDTALASFEAKAAEAALADALDATRREAETLATRDALPEANRCATKLARRAVSRSFMIISIVLANTLHNLRLFFVMHK